MNICMDHQVQRVRFRCKKFVEHRDLAPMLSARHGATVWCKGCAKDHPCVVVQDGFDIFYNIIPCFFVAQMRRLHVVLR